MPYMISSWTVADNASLSISKSKLVYRSMIFVNNKLTLICQQLATVSVRHTQLILLIWRVLHLWGKKCKANGAYDTCNFAKCSPFKKNSLTCKLNDKFVINNPSQLKCLAVLSSDLSLITIHISDCRQFSNIHISHSSVAVSYTHLTLPTIYSV